MEWYTYLLVCETKTYVGMTNNLERRLRQHNGHLSGGARATRGLTWERACHVRGFQTKVDALKFEWRWKYLTRQAKGTSHERRLAGLEACLAFFNDSMPQLEVVFE